MELITKNEKETLSFAKKIALEAKGGNIFALFGDLGSGKTTFTKGLALGLGIKKTITSPTFTIMKQYPLTEGAVAKFLAHIDCYRLTSKEDLCAIGFFEIINNPDYIVVLEWPECIWPEIKDRALRINFEHISETERKISR